MNKKDALILGGAGFIGSNISKRFLNGGYRVIVIDGLLKNTGGRIENLLGILKDIEFIQERIEKVKNLKNYVQETEIIVDCMGWTAHLAAFKNPSYDLELNALSHLRLIDALKNCPYKNIIYIASRGQYGNSDIEEITEETKMEPLDVQGVNKLTAENYFRIFSKRLNLNVASLRLGNCFGQNQLIDYEDIGLVGSLIKNSLLGKEIVIYGKKRKRALTYVVDVVEVVFQLAEGLLSGFNAYNLAGSDVYLIDIAKKILDITGSGSVKIEDMPKDIGGIDIGNAKVNEDKLKTKLGKIPVTNLDLALKSTINYFKDNL